MNTIESAWQTLLDMGVHGCIRRDIADRNRYKRLQYASNARYFI